ncbi:MAG: efflux RND transporter periplasmic adaptor subunit [Chlorobi bacterium]|nr:efflux RND transporter periplasmic adaptor subunit [Chlorobiota bacterium]
MKRWKLIVATFLVTSFVIAVLAYNKRSLQERRSQNVIQTVIPVATAVVQWDTLYPTLELVGTVIPNNIVQVASETNGRIVSSSVELGRVVRQGEVLYVIDDELRRAQLLTAEANYAKAKSDSARYWFLKQKESVPDAQWDQVLLQYRLAEAQLIQARRAFADTRIRAPISGVITAKRVDVGTIVNPGTIVCEIVDVSKFKVQLNISEQDLPFIRVGTRVELRSDVIPGRVFQGKVTAIAPKASDVHTFPLEITISPPFGELKAGMFVRARFIDLLPIAGLTIPRDAVIGSSDNAYVFVLDTLTKTVHRRSIRCGIERNGIVTVLDGLQSGEQVVVTGTNVVTDGATVAVTNTGTHQ